MSQDPQKSQKTATKKRGKQKTAAQRKAHIPKLASLSTFSPKSIIREARTYPLVGCWISSNWKQESMELTEVLVARQQPDGNICFGMYLIDKLCLGLKNTLAKTGLPAHEYENAVYSIFRGAPPTKAPAELAHQMIYASIEYAAKFGFMPEKDFALTQNLLAPRGELPETYKITFGKKGKPFFISGPYDDVDQIIKQLEKTAGPGNFEVLVMGNPF